MITELARITDTAKARPKERFTSLAYLINVDSLRARHWEMNGKKATRIDRVTKEEYEANLEENLIDLVSG